MRKILQFSLAPLLGVFVAASFVVSQPAPAQAACSALPSDKGQATFTVSIPSTGTYRFWAHMYSPSSGNNAMYLQVDQAYCNITVGNSSSQPTGQFTWVDYQNGTTTNKIDMSLSAGNHTVILAGLDPSVGVDKVMFAADTSCVPSGDGSNCVASATPTPTSTGTPGPTPSPTVLLTPAPAILLDCLAEGAAIAGRAAIVRIEHGEARRHQELDGAVLLSSTIEASSLAPQRDEQTRQAVIRQMRFEVRTVLSPGKPTMISSMDDPTSKERFQVEVTATKIK